MAQRVCYYEDFVAYTEGPFVMVQSGGWRIEVELKDHHCPVLLDGSINELIRQKGLPEQGKYDDGDLCACVVDYLNAKVKDGTIELVDRTWTWPLAALHIKHRLSKY